VRHPFQGLIVLMTFQVRPFHGLVSVLVPGKPIATHWRGEAQDTALMPT
jgi:hypothetical protein